MGNDGGSIPGRRDLVKEKSKEVKVDNEIVAEGRATLCTLTKQKLAKPIMACRLGYFYCKEAILKALIDKNLPKKFKYINSIKDVCDVSLAVNTKTDSTFPFVCPLSQIEFNGLNRFVLIWNCGCAFSEKLFNETKNVEKQKCLFCGKPFKAGDVISLNMNAEQQETVRSELIKKLEEKKAKKAALKAEKEAKEAKNVKEKEEYKDELHKTQVIEPHANILEKLDDPEFKKIKELEGKSATYSKLFHKDGQGDGGKDLIFRNVRFGIR